MALSAFLEPQIVSFDGATYAPQSIECFDAVLRRKTLTSIIRRTKAVTFSLLERHALLLKAARHVQYFAWRTRIALTSVFGTSENADAIIYADPATIKEYIGELPWSRHGLRGRVVGGDWDLRKVPFEPWDLFKAMKARFVDGVHWSNTSFYTRVAGEINDGQIKWGCRSIAEFEDRLQSLDRLYDTIQKEGYRSQADLTDRDQHVWDRDNPFSKHDEVIVCIDRDGHILLRDGKHRLSIAKLQGLPAIPLAVGLRHSRWSDIKDQIVSWKNSDIMSSGEPVPHADIDPATAHSPPPSIDILASSVGDAPQRVLIADASLGFLAHRFEAAGHDVTAIEAQNVARHFLHILRDASYRTFSIVADLDDVAPTDYGIICIPIGTTGRSSAESLKSTTTLIKRLSIAAPAAEMFLVDFRSSTKDTSSSLQLPTDRHHSAFATESAGPGIIHLPAHRPE